MSAKTIMVQGTGSYVGKSVITTGLCRMLRQDGFRVAPFKAQNMSNNSYVTQDGGEIGRAQAVQAEAAGIQPTIHMNPILLKPASDMTAQVILWGKPYKTLEARDYQFHTSLLLDHVKTSLNRLMDEYEVVVIEGAGSPAEINLERYDIVNMLTAEMADAPVILVGDIDRGGVFASLIGTLELLRDERRKRIQAFLINKFRGDVSLLEPGLDFLLKRTGIPTLGVIPYETKLDLLEEDGLSEERIRTNGILTRPNNILIDVVWLPRISNVTDFAPLDGVEEVTLTYLREIPNRFPDALILPGTKSTIADLQFLRASGLERWIHECVKRGVTIVGICGGYQMLGEKILDPLGVESTLAEVRGLGLISAITTFRQDKTTQQVRALHLKSGIEVNGYEIHMGTTILPEVVDPLFRVVERAGCPADIADGVLAKNGQIWGTYLHGIFESGSFRNFFLNQLRHRKGFLPSPDFSSVCSKEETYDRLADLIRSNMDLNLFDQILNRKKLVQI